MRILTLPEEHARWWPQVDRFRQTPAAWHAVPWERSPWYLDLVEWAAGHLWHRPIEYLYQAEPNLRIQEPGNVAVPWHADRDFGHHPCEWNVWVPLTPLVDDSQRVWFGSDDHPYCPTVDLGQALVFPGAIMRHGNQVNTSGRVRRSFDFRLIPADQFTDRGHSTVNYGVRMAEGDYWRRHPATGKAATPR